MPIHETGFMHFNDNQLIKLFMHFTIHYNNFSCNDFHNLHERCKKLNKSDKTD